jgi:hypothetical protein
MRKADPYQNCLALARAIRETYTDMHNISLPGEDEAFRAKAREILEAAIQRNGITGLRRQMLYEAAARPGTQWKFKRRPGRKNRKARARFWQVGVYDCDQAFGGPEEGGWWYSVGVLTSKPETFYSEERMLARRNQLDEHLDALQEGDPRANLGSVLCTGRLVAHSWRGLAPFRFPDSRPYYE